MSMMMGGANPGGGRITPPKGSERTADKATRKRNLRRVAGLFRPYWRKLVWLTVLIVLSAALGLVPAFLTRDLINSVPWGRPPGPNFSITHVYLLVAGMVIIPIITGVIGVAQTWSSNRVGQEVMHDLRASVYRHLQRLSLAFFTRTRTGEVQSRIANDIGGVDTVVTTTATSIASNVTTVLATAVALIVLDWRLALAAFALLPIFVLMTRKIGRVRREIASTKQGSLADISSLVEESLSVSGVLLGKTMGKSNELTDNFEPGEPPARRARAAPAHGRPLDDGLDPGDLLDHAGARLRARRIPVLPRQHVDLDRHAGRLHGAADPAVLPRGLAAERAGRRADLARAVRPRVRVPRPARRDRRGREPDVDPSLGAPRRGRVRRRRLLLRGRPADAAGHQLHRGGRLARRPRR